jgi:hypothetical protein
MNDSNKTLYLWEIDYGKWLLQFNLGHLPPILFWAISSEQRPLYEIPCRSTSRFITNKKPILDFIQFLMLSLYVLHNKVCIYFCMFCYHKKIQTLTLSFATISEALSTSLLVYFVVRN